MKLLSVCNGEDRRGTVQELIKHYEGRGYAAEREGDTGKMNDNFQHADHYKRVAKGKR